MFTMKCLCMCNAKHFFLHGRVSGHSGARVWASGSRCGAERCQGSGLWSGVQVFGSPVLRSYYECHSEPIPGAPQAISNLTAGDTCTTALAKDDMEPYAGPFCRAVVFTGPLQGPFETGLPLVHHKGDCLEVQRSPECSSNVERSRVQGSSFGTTYLPLW